MPHPLPDDNVAEMNALCILIHYQEPTMFESEMDLRRLRNLSILADKYACREAVKYWADMWIGRLNHDNETSREDEKVIVDLLVVSYLLDLSFQFTGITRRMVYWFSRAAAFYHFNEYG